MGAAANRRARQGRAVGVSAPRAEAGQARADGRRSRGAEVPGLAARRGALALLSAVFDYGAMLGDGAEGSGAERAEARGLAELVLRRLGQLDAVLAQFVERPPAGAGRQILRLMAAELLFGGTPPHAAVDMGVRLAGGDRKTARLKGLVNAVGRRLAENGAALVASQDAARLNCPGWLWQALSRDWGEDRARVVAEAHLAGAPLDLTPRVPGDAAALAEELGGRVLSTGSIRLEGRPQVTALPGFEAGAWWVQDAAASLPARLVPEVAGRRVLDLCAAPGGKAMQLAASGTQVTALDISTPRMERLRENLERTGLEAEIVVADALEWEPARAFDAVLLDAPCTATGTIRRHPELPYRIDKRSLSALVELQARLMDRAWSWLAPGGVLVFCTCSLFRAEGEDQAAAFLSRTADAVAMPVSTEDGVLPELIDDGWLRTRPDLWADRGGLDGFFAARFRRAS